MYRIEDEISAIKNIQRLIFLNQTGAYDEKTRNSVLEIQKKQGSTPSGIVDYETFRLIVENYHKKASQKSSEYLFGAKYPYEYGDIGENIVIINNAVSAVLKDFRYNEDHPKGAFFGHETINGIRYLRKAFCMEESDSADPAFINRLFIERNAIDIKNKFFK